MGGFTQSSIKIYQQTNVTVCLNFTFSCLLYGKTEFTFFFYIEPISKTSSNRPRSGLTKPKVFRGVVMIMTPVWRSSRPYKTLERRKATLSQTNFALIVCIISLEGNLLPYQTSSPTPDDLHNPLHWI